MTTDFGRFRIGYKTHQGPRETNQDTILSIALPGDRWLLAVADGMGGLEEGELASQTALGSLYQNLSDGSTLLDAAENANAAVTKKAHGRMMGTTLVAAVVSGRQAEIVNVGDSRAYQSDLLGLIQVTHDHTVAYEAERTGMPLPGGEEDGSTPWGTALARYLGEGPEVEVDRFGPLDLIQGGWLLLCSDGLHNVLSPEDMDTLLAETSDAEEAASQLVEEALSKGTEDNVSVALLHWPDAAPVASAPSPAHPKSRGDRQEGIFFKPKEVRRKKSKTGLALKVFLVVIPLMIALVFLIDWILSL